MTMAAGFPKFVPILSAYATRVSGRSFSELLSSSAALARALADTQRVIGHDGVLCLYQPAALAQCCVTSGPSFCPPDDLPRTGTMAVVLEAARVLRKQLSPNTHIIACFPGPALMLAELKKSCGPEPSELADYDYVGDAFVATIRTACETGIDGIAVVEDVPAGPSQELTSLYRSARKLVDFYSCAFCFFLQPGSAVTDGTQFADYTFSLPPFGGSFSLVRARAVSGAAPATTACDVPPDVSVEALLALREQAMQ